MADVSAKRLEAQIAVHVNGHSWTLSQEEARELRSKIGAALDIHNELVIERLKQLCCRKFNISMSALMSEDRSNFTVYPRQAVMWLAKQAGFRRDVIARHLLRNGTSVSHGIKCMIDRIGVSREWKRTMATLREEAEKEMAIQFPPQKGDQ